MLSITAQKGKNFLLTLILKRIISWICMANRSCAGCTEEAQEAPALQIISIQQESQALWKSGLCQSLDCNGHVCLLEKNLWKIATLRGQDYSLDLAEKLNLPCPRRGWCEDTSLPALLKSNYKFLLLATAQVFLFLPGLCYLYTITAIEKAFNQDISMDANLAQLYLMRVKLLNRGILI